MYNSGAEATREIQNWRWHKLYTPNNLSYSSSNVMTMAWAWLAAAAACRSWTELSPLIAKSFPSSQSPARSGRRSKGAMQAATADVLILFWVLLETTVCIIIRILMDIRRRHHMRTNKLFSIPEEAKLNFRASISIRGKSHWVIKQPY